MLKVDPLKRELTIILLGSCLFVLACLLTAANGHAELTPQQERGKSIYLTGKSSTTNQTITAYFGSERIAIPAETSPCASCHGYDGTGRPESGLVPSNITWRFLTKSYGHLHANGIKHAPFSHDSLKRYLKEGLYPEGVAASDPNMPLYEMPDQDLENLIAYMTQLGDISATGVTPTIIRIGTLLPGEGPLAEVGHAINNILKAYFDEVNDKGGIYGRKLELATLFLSAGQEGNTKKIETWLEEQQLFALLSTFLPEAEIDLADVVKKQNIPLVGPFTLFPLSTYSKNRQIFYLYPGLKEQMQTLAQYVTRKVPLLKPQMAVLYPNQGNLDSVLSGIRQLNREQNWPTPLEITLDPKTADLMIGKLKAAAVDLVIFLGDERQTKLFLQAAVAERWVPYILGSGILAGKTIIDAPNVFSDRIFLSYPSLPGDRQEWGIKALFQLQKSYNLPKSHIQARISAFTSAKILIEALRLSGRKVDRKQLIATLEEFSQFDTGLTPPVSYSGNQHIGVQGTHIIRFNAQRNLEEILSNAIWMKLH